MIMANPITRTEQVSGALKSFLKSLRTMLAKQSVAFTDHGSSTRDWDAFLGEVLGQSTPLSQEARERRKAMARIMRSADFGTKISTVDWLLLEDNHSGAIALYDRIAIDHPDEIGFCLRCIGAAHCALRNYETAIEFYQKALASGEDPEAIADDISEARSAIMMRDQRRRKAA